MGLDVYVGSLTRYYSGSWETAIQRWGREQGVPVAVLRQRPTIDEVADPRRVRESVIGWRTILSRELTKRVENVAPIPGLVGWHPQYIRPTYPLLGRSLDWEESDETPYFTDKPDWYGYVALLLLAAHAEHPELEQPIQLPDRWTEDAAWRAASEDGFRRAHYRQILQPELWLPCDFDFTLEAEDPSGQDVFVGSSVALLAELHELNRRQFHGAAASYPIGAGHNAEPGVTFESVARFGLAIFLHLAEQSVAHRIPMKLDY